MIIRITTLNANDEGHYAECLSCCKSIMLSVVILNNIILNITAVICFIV
jgi:hypothetical protein